MTRVDEVPVVELTPQTTYMIGGPMLVVDHSAVRDVSALSVGTKVEIRQGEYSVPGTVAAVQPATIELIAIWPDE